MNIVVTKKSLGSGDYHHVVVTKGGSGSGDFGHAGRPGEVGGSVPGQGMTLGDFIDDAPATTPHDKMVADWQKQHLGLAVYQQEIGNRGIYVYEDSNGAIRLRTYENGDGSTQSEHYSSLHEAYTVGVEFLENAERRPVRLVIKRPSSNAGVLPAPEGHESKLLRGLLGGEEAGNVFYEKFGTELDDFLENAYVQDLGNGINTIIDVGNSTVYRNKDGVPYMLHIAGIIQDRVNDPNGIGKAGYFTRNIDLVDKSIENVHFELNPAYQNKGIGMDMYRTSEQASADAGFNDIKLYADMSVGGYAWARMGYDFDRHKYKGGDAVINNSDYENVMRVLKDKWYDRYGSDIPKKYTSMKHSWDIAMIRGPDDHHIGKDTMRYCGWYGVKSLNPKSKGYKVGQLYYAARDYSRP